MPRPPNPIPTRPLNLAVPEDLRVRLDLLLFSELEGRVPQGAYGRFLLPLLRAALDGASLDLGRWTGADPGEQVVRSDASTIQALLNLLERSEA